MIGGVCWAFKAGAIMATGDQPPLVFEIAPVFFAIGLFGLHARFRGRGGLPASIGVGLAGVSACLAILGIIFNPPNMTEESFSAFTTGSFLAHIVALVLLGIATRRTRSLPGRWRFLPLTIAASMLPLMMLGGVLGVISERLFELPILVLGIAWVWLGYLIATAGEVVPEDSQTVSVLTSF